MLGKIAKKVKKFAYTENKKIIYWKVLSNHSYGELGIGNWELGMENGKWKMRNERQVLLTRGI